MAKSLVFDKNCNLADIKQSLREASPAAIGRGIEFLASGASWTLSDTEFIDELLPLFPVKSSTSSSSPAEVTETRLPQSFTVDGAVDFTDRSVSALVDRIGSALQVVRFADCRHLDAESAVSAVGRSCQRLRSMAIVCRYEDDGRGPMPSPSPPPSSPLRTEGRINAVDTLTVPNGHAVVPSSTDSIPASTSRSGTSTAVGEGPVVSALIRVASSTELISVSFVGFHSVTDVDVGYLADCYQSTLRRIELAGCRSVSDLGLSALAERCGKADRLRDVSFAATRVTDRGVALLAAACPRLRRVDLSRCSAVTDDGVRKLAVGCRRLERVQLVGCRSVTDRGLDALVMHCPGLHAMDFSRTSVVRVTPLVLALAKLTSLGLDECDRLVCPPLEVATRGLDAVKRFYADRNPSNRVRVMFIGDELSGKSSVIRRLVETTDAEADDAGKTNSTGDGRRSCDEPPHTDAVDTFLWQPCVALAATVPEASDRRSVVGRSSVPQLPRNLQFELWDITGRQVCQGIHQMMFVGSSLFVIVFDVSEKSSCDRLPSHVNSVQQKVPGSIILLVGTHVDKLPPEGDTVEGRMQDLMYCVQDAECRAVENIKSELLFLRTLEQDTKVVSRTESLNALLSKRPRLPTTIADVLLVSSIFPLRGFDALRKALIDHVTSTDTTCFGHVFKTPSMTGVAAMSTIHRLRVNLNLNSDGGTGELGQTDNDDPASRPAHLHATNDIRYRRHRRDDEIYRFQTVMMSWSQLVHECRRDEPNLMANEESIESELSLLQTVGACVEFRLPKAGHVIAIDQRSSSSMSSMSAERFICIDPPLFARLLCLAHVDDGRDGYGRRSHRLLRVDAERFWPTTRGWTRPAPRVVIRALEDIPRRGLLRECLLPVLWQDHPLSDDQLQLVLDVARRLGLFRACAAGAGLTAGDVSETQSTSLSTATSAADDAADKTLTVYGYPSLSGQRRYYASLTDLLSSKRPQLHWSGRPSKGDVQINWRYELPNGVPYGLKCRLLALCYCVGVSDSRVTYRHIWNDGVLFSIGELATVCVEYETKRVDVCCRVNADEPGHESTAIEYLWAQSSTFLLVVQQFLDSWPGLFYKTSLVPHGLALFNGDVIAAERSFPLLQCLQVADNVGGPYGVAGAGVIRFIDDNIRRSLNARLMIPYNPAEHEFILDWMALIHERRHLVSSLVEKDDVDENNVSEQRIGNDGDVDERPTDLQGVSPSSPIQLLPTRSKSVLRRTVVEETDEMAAERRKPKIKIRIKWDLGDGIETVQNNIDPQSNEEHHVNAGSRDVTSPNIGNCSSSDVGGADKRDGQHTTVDDSVPSERFSINFDRSEGHTRRNAPLVEVVKITVASAATQCNLVTNVNDDLTHRTAVDLCLTSSQVNDIRTALCILV